MKVHNPRFFVLLAAIISQYTNEARLIRASLSDHLTPADYKAMATRPNRRPRNLQRRNGPRTASNASALQRIGSNNNIVLYDAEAVHRLDAVNKAPPHFTEKVKVVTSYTSSAGGTINIAHDADPVAGSGPVNAWSTRYQTLFREYRVVSIRVTAESLTGNAGKCMLTIDDANGTTPTTALMEDQGYVTLSNAVGSQDSHAGGKWTLADTGESSWILTSQGRTPCYIKLYTDNAFWAAPAAATTKIVLHVLYTIEFRGRV